VDDLLVGKVYAVACRRKGRFEGRLEAFDETLATLTITRGRASAMLAENELGVGETVTVRRSFAFLAEVSGG